MAKKTAFEREVRELLEKTFPFTYRISDVIGKRFVKKKPADFVACDEKGSFVMVEAKSTRTGGFSFSQIPDHQREALTTIAMYGRAFLALNLREKNGPGQAWLIPWSWWLDFERLWRKKSIRAEEAAQAFRMFALTRITGGWK